MTCSSICATKKEDVILSSDASQSERSLPAIDEPLGQAGICPLSRTEAKYGSIARLP
jgi:hypothetical protein